MFWHRRKQSDFQEEIRAHLALEMDRLRAEGFSEEDARSEAQRAFGNLTRAEENFYEQGRWRVLDELIQDLRWFVRLLRKAPASTAAIIGTFGLTVGVNTAIFTLVNALLLTNLPYRDPAQLVLLNRVNRLQFVASSKRFADWKRRSTLLQDSALYSVAEANDLGGDEPRQVHVAQITANLPALMDAIPQLGRSFGVDEDQPGHDSVAMISSQLWREQFGANPNVCGRTIRLNGIPFSIVGVLPPGFDFPSGVQIWTPTIHSFQRLTQGGAFFVSIVARMNRGATPEQVSAQQRTFLREQNPGSERDVDSVGGVVYQRPPIVQPLRTQMSRAVRKPILVAFGAVLLLLLIGCANVTSLAMARAASRQREFAVREAMGITGARLFRQLFTEHALLGILGGVAGLLLAFLGLNFLKTLLPPDWPHYARIDLDCRVLAFTAVLSVATSILSGLLPTWRLARKSGAIKSLAAGERTSDRLQPRRAYNLLVCAETAIATILLCGAGSLVNSFIQLEGVDLGFQPQQVLAITVSHPEPRERSGDAAIFYRDVISGMRSVRGFQQVAGVSYLPIRRGTEPLIILPVNPAGGSFRSARAGATPISITPGYFGTMRIPFLQGRDFNDFDQSGSSPVAIVNETLSRQLWPGQEALEHRLTIGGVGPMTVVGVVGSVRFLGPSQEPIAELYRPYTQWTPDAFSFVIRTDGPPDRYAASARATLHRIAPNQAITQTASMDDYIGQQLRRPRSLATMISAFALLGFALAALGIYGLVSYAAERRTREFGIRLALGAEPRGILLASARGALYPVLGGVMLGITMSVSADRILRSELYQTRTTDPMLLWTVAGLLICTAVLSGLLASRKVISIDPAEILRHE